MQRVWKKRLFALFISGVTFAAILFFFALPLYERYLADQIRLSLRELPYPVSVGDINVNFSQKMLYFTDAAVTADAPDGSILRVKVGRGTIEGIGAGLFFDAEGVISVLESAAFADISFLVELPSSITHAPPAALMPEREYALNKSTESQEGQEGATGGYGGSLSLEVERLAFRNLSGNASALGSLKKIDRAMLLPVLNSFSLEGLEIGSLVLQEELPPPYTDKEKGSITSLFLGSASVAQLTLMQAEGVRLGHMRHAQQGHVLNSFLELTIGRLHYPGIFGQLPLPVTSVEDVSIVSLWFQAGQGANSIVSCNKLAFSLGIPFGRLALKGSVEGLDIPASATKDWFGVTLVSQNTSEHLTLSGAVDITATLPITTPVSSVTLKKFEVQIDDLVDMTVNGTASVENPHYLLDGSARILLEQASASFVNKGLVALHEVTDAEIEKPHSDAAPVTRSMEGYTAPAIRQLARDIECFFIPENRLVLSISPKNPVKLLAAFMYEEAEAGFLQLESVCEAYSP